MSEPLTPISTPPAHLWRQLRLQYLPVVVFVIGLVAATVIWIRWVAPPTIVAEVEAIRADVRPIKTGTLTDVKVSLLQTVHAGDVLAQIIVADPRVVEASLAVIRAELDSIRITMNPVMGQQRAALDYERLVLDLMNAKVQLTSLQAQLFQAESTFVRTNALFSNKLVTEERFEEIKNTRDALAAQVKAQMELIERIQPGVNAFAAQGPDGRLPSAADGLRAAIKLEEEKLRLATAEFAPVPLVAPIDGVVTLAHRHSGETVAAGEAVFQISAARAERIVGFLRQPLGDDLKPGTPVEVRTRTLQRAIGHATIAQVGHQLEPISPTLLAAMRLPTSSANAEFGLRVLVTIPAGLKLLPGEHVDVIVRQ